MLSETNFLWRWLICTATYYGYYMWLLHHSRMCRLKIKGYQSLTGEQGQEVQTVKRTNCPRPLLLHTHPPNLGHPLHPVHFGPPLSRSLQVSLTRNFPERGSLASGSAPRIAPLRCCMSGWGSPHMVPVPHHLPLPPLHPLPPACWSLAEETSPHCCCCPEVGTAQSLCCPDCHRAPTWDGSWTPLRRSAFRWCWP